MEIKEIIEVLKRGLNKYYHTNFYVPNFGTALEETIKILEKLKDKEDDLK